MPLLLTDSDVNQVMTMQDCVGVMEDMLDQAHRGMAWFQPRSHIRTPVGYHHIMPGALLDSGVVGLKVYTARFPAGSRFLTRSARQPNGRPFGPAARGPVLPAAYRGP